MNLKVIKQNLNGINKLSKQRIFGELQKIVELENLEDIQSNKVFYEIFNIIFPELKYLNRLKGIESKEIKAFIKLENNLLFALLMIDDTDNHLYFSHKYKISNLLKEYLAFIHLHFIQAKKK